MPDSPARPSMAIPAPAPRPEPRPRRSPCQECAFKPGAAAYLEPYNQLRARVCAQAGLPFFCHRKVPWRAQRSWSAADRRANARAAGICEGWVARVRELNAAGHYSRYRLLRRAVARELLDTLELWLPRQRPPKKIALEFTHGFSSLVISSDSPAPELGKIFSEI